METIEGLHPAFHCTPDPGGIIVGQTFLLHPQPDPGTTDSPPHSMAAAKAPDSLFYGGRGERAPKPTGVSKKTHKLAVCQHPTLTGTHTLNEPP